MRRKPWRNIISTLGLLDTTPCEPPSTSKVFFAGAAFFGIAAREQREEQPEKRRPDLRRGETAVPLAKLAYTRIFDCG